MLRVTTHNAVKFWRFLVLTQSGTGQLLVELWCLVPGLTGPVGPVWLQSRQEFEQSLLRDLAASSLQVREACKTKAALQSMLLGFKRFVARGKAFIGSHRLHRRGRGDCARHACLRKTSERTTPAAYTVKLKTQGWMKPHPVARLYTGYSVKSASTDNVSSGGNF